MNETPLATALKRRVEEILEITAEFRDEFSSLSNSALADLHTKEKEAIEVTAWRIDAIEAETEMRAILTAMHACGVKI